MFDSLRKFFFFLKKDNISIFLGFDGKPTRKYGFAWNESPLDFGYAFPYVIGLLPSGVELRTSTNPNTVQMINICKGASCLAVSDEQIYCASSGVVWRLEPVPIWEQVAQLVQDNEFTEAIILLDCLPDSIEKKEKKTSINVKYAFHLFHLGQHEAALEKFLTLKEDPMRILGLYPSMLPHGVIEKRDFQYPYGVNLNEAKLENAYKALALYLQKVRLEYVEEAIKLETSEIPVEYNQCGELIPVVLDTSLMKCLIKIDHPFLVELVSRPNCCHIGVCEALLLQAKKFRELVLLYKNKNLHTNALQLLQKLGKENVGDMKGVRPTANYLMQLGNEDLNLILEYSVWVLKEDADLGLEIFTTKRKPGQELNPTLVLKHIDKMAPTEVSEYLEFIIGQGETDPAFHNELVINYLNSCKAILKNPSSNQRVAQKADSEIGLLGVCRKKLLKFLETSKYYKAERMLSQFPTNDLYEERAILLSRIGRHEQALSIYAHKLEDVQMAENYCKRHYEMPDADEDCKRIYVTLLGVYLNPPDKDKKPMEAPALHLLNRYYDRMDTITALKLLPPSIPVRKIESFLMNVLQSNERVLRENNLQRALLRSETLTVKENWHKVRGTRIKITDKQTCPDCGKRIGKDVTFVYLPNGTVKHYICYSKSTSVQSTSVHATSASSEF